MNDGTVYLVGGGPGGPELVTHRAFELVASCDVLVYDALAPQALLDAAPATAEKINAGKRKDKHVLKQDETNELLVRLARAGKRVVRLKGGDPFVYGRGGEEAEHLRNAGVRFEYVPGVTSSIAVPGYAGIPVTQRGVADTFTVVTANKRADEDGNATSLGEAKFTWLAEAPGTLVFLMGLSRVRHVCTELIRGGKSGDTPAAVISNGARPSQRTVTARLADLPEAVEEAALETPAIIVVGDVVNMREKIEWFEHRPLFGTTVAVTRARAQSSTLATQLEDLGAQVVECPAISIEPMNGPDLDIAINRLDETGMVIFTSANGARRFFERLAARGLDARSLGSTKVAVVGSATARTCQEHGIVPDYMPPEGKRTSEGLLDTLQDEPVYSSRVVLITAERHMQALPDGLRDLGANLEIVPAYRNVIESPDEMTLARVQAADIITFTSASTVTNMLQFVDGPDDLPPAITIGPRTTEAATTNGVQVRAQAADPSVASLLVAVLQQAESRRF